MLVHLNGKLIPAKEALISVFDHGFLYGDGVYETMRVYDGVTFMLDEHLNRLYRSALMIGLIIPVEVNSLKNYIYDTLIANSLKEAFVRLTVSRGYGPIGIDPDLCHSPTIVIIAQEMRDYPKSFYERGISLIISEIRRNPREALNPQIKSLNFLNNILAKIEAKKKGSYDAIMLNVYGMVTESTISNIFFYKENVLCTPSPDCGILEGITRGIIIEIALRDGLIVKEGEFTKEDLYSADEVFITNTTLEVMPVSRIDNKEYPVGNITRLLHKAYKEEVKAYVAKVKAEGPSIWGYE
ncbi:MAG: aminotransferase class IV [Nitrospirae bacterium]|nr:aminotransferase class IV [Nitrospirota bacterium]